jgi:hypothetical protein
MTGRKCGNTFDAGILKQHSMKNLINLIPALVMSCIGIPLNAQLHESMPSAFSGRNTVNTIYPALSFRASSVSSQTPAQAFSGQKSASVRERRSAGAIFQHNAFRQVSGLKQKMSIQKLFSVNTMNMQQNEIQLGLRANESEPFFKNRRNIYSGLWAFATLNYLYADIAGLMDANMLAQYQTGTVGGMRITPGFLTAAACFMQVPIANVFLPHVIKNERTLRWVQIASGAFMTLAQSATLFMGKPSPYYAVFSAFEIAATAYITIDAIRWKPGVK